MFYIVILIVMCDLRDEQKKERMWFNSDVFLCLVGKWSTVLDSFTTT